MPQLTNMRCLIFKQLLPAADDIVQALFFIVKVFYKFKLLFKLALVVEFLFNTSAIFPDSVLYDGKPFRYTV